MAGLLAPLWATLLETALIMLVCVVGTVAVWGYLGWAARREAREAAAWVALGWIPVAPGSGGLGWDCLGAMEQLANVDFGWDGEGWGTCQADWLLQSFPERFREDRRGHWWYRPPAPGVSLRLLSDATLAVMACTNTPDPWALPAWTRWHLEEGYAWRRDSWGRFERAEALRRVNRMSREEMEAEVAMHLLGSLK